MKKWCIDAYLEKLDTTEYSNYDYFHVSGNVPIEIEISEVRIDHSKAHHILFSIDNNNRKGKKNDRDRIVKVEKDWCKKRDTTWLSFSVILAKVGHKHP